MYRETSSAVTSALRGVLPTVYTTNPICSKKQCVNPVFPGLEDLQRLEQAPWIASSLSKTAPSMRFCRNAVDYDPALPAGGQQYGQQQQGGQYGQQGSQYGQQQGGQYEQQQGGQSDWIHRTVQRQDNAAATTYYYHIYALGLDAWDYQKPQYASDCIKAVWRMACFTYFPRAEMGIMEGAHSRYIRPCQSSCQNYLRTCGVECCDESVQCVFSHTRTISPTPGYLGPLYNVSSSGYLPHDGPSSLCTGGARPSARRLSAGLWALVILVVALSLQGCTYDVPVHKIGNWRAEPDYLIQHSFVAPGASAKDPHVNSCSIKRLSESLQCSGRGACTLWVRADQGNELAFCKCDKYWADPECRTARKSQTLAYLLSMFFGILGADKFYLGFPGLGVVKLLTLGGGGVWWVWDIISIGSAPVYSHDFRVAADLPHWAFVLSCVMFAAFLGFAAAYILVVTYRARKRKEAMLLAEQEEFGSKGQVSLFADAYGTQGGYLWAGGKHNHQLHGNPVHAPGGPAGTTVTTRLYGGQGGVLSGAVPTMGSMAPMRPMNSMRTNVQATGSWARQV